MSFILEMFNPVERRTIGKLSVLRPYADSIENVGSKQAPVIRISTSDSSKFKTIQRIIRCRGKHTGLTFTIIEDNSDA